MPVRRRRRLARSITAVAAAAATVLAAAPGASAGVLVTAAGACKAQPLSKPFLPWGDPGDYFLASNGGLERGASGWTLAGGATVVSDNEAFAVNDARDTRSLELPAGAAAVSGVSCVGINRPSMRFFVRQSGGGAAAYLRVDALFEDAAGTTRAMTIGALGASDSWQPAPVLAITPSLLPLLPDAQTPVAFQFAATGGTFRVDDIYVDPYGGR